MVVNPLLLLLPLLLHYLLVSRFPKEHPEMSRAGRNAPRAILPSYMDDERAIPAFADHDGNWQQADAMSVDDDAEHVPCEGHCYDGVCAPKSLPCRAAPIAIATTPTRAALTALHMRARGMRSA